MFTPSGEQFEIAFEDQSAVVVEVGGGLRSYAVGDRQVLDGYGEDEMCSSGRGQVLIPWPNRIAYGRYEFGGRHLQLPIDELGTNASIHGLIRWSGWTAAECGDDRVVVQHELHPQPGYPFALDLRIEYDLSEQGLRVKTRATNVGVDPCPFGAGAHPYLLPDTAHVDDARLRLPARRMLETDESGIPSGSSPVAGTAFDFLQGRAVGPLALDHCFTDLARGEDGLARVTLAGPEAAVTLWMDEAYRYVMLYTGDDRPDVDRRSIAVEPMTCPPQAFRSGEDVLVLDPGESVAARWGLSRD